MTLSECYDALGGGFDEVLGRLRSESLVEKFLLKFPADPSFDLLKTSVAAENWPEAFRGAHTLKGVCQNLGLTALYRSSAALCDALRGSEAPHPALVAEVEEDYRRTVAAIAAFRGAATL